MDLVIRNEWYAIYVFDGWFLVEETIEDTLHCGKRITRVCQVPSGVILNVSLEDAQRLRLFLVSSIFPAIQSHCSGVISITMIFGMLEIFVTELVSWLQAIPVIVRHNHAKRLTAKLSRAFEIQIGVREYQLALRKELFLVRPSSCIIYRGCVDWIHARRNGCE